MKRILSLPQFCVRIFIALVICIGGCLPAQAQFAVKNSSVVVKAGTLFSVDGLLFTPTEDATFTENTLQKSSEPVDYAGSASISLVYTFDTPISYAGTLGLRYTNNMLNGAVADNIKLIYVAAEAEPFMLIPETVVNTAKRVAGYDFESLTTIQQLSALALDVAPPVVTAITVSGTPSATSEVLQFTVFFNESPNNVSVDDFTLSSTGTVRGRIASVSPVTSNSVTVTIDEIAGTGTLRLNLGAGTDITDNSGNGNNTNGYVAAFTDGDQHTVDREAPDALSLDLDPTSDTGNSNTDNITNNTMPTFIGMTEPNATVEVTSDIEGSLGSTTADVNGDWSYTLTAALTEGVHTLTAIATDTVGNSSTASSALVLKIDVTAPTATVVLSKVALAAGETSPVTITFNEAVVGFDNSDLNAPFGTTTTVTTSDGGLTWSATFTPQENITANDNTIDLNNTGVTDIAGNMGMGTSYSNKFAIDTQRPTATITVSDTELLTRETAMVTFAFNKAVTSFTNDDLRVDNATLTAVSSSDGGITWTATLTPMIDSYEPENVITLDNTGIIDISGNTGRGTSSSNNYVIRTKVFTLLVTSFEDSGEDYTLSTSWDEEEVDGSGLSLREALYWARPGDSVTFAQQGTIVLSGSQLDIKHNKLTIAGDLDDDGQPDVTISGNHTSRLFSVNNDLSDVNIIGLVLTEGMVSGGGAGLYIGVNSTVTVRQSRISNNTEMGIGGGGVFGTSATLIMINSTVSDNTSSSFGGGIRIVGSGGTLHLINSTVNGNMTNGTGAHGGGIQFGGSGNLTVVNSTVSGNTATGAASLGGGLRITSGTAYIYNTTIVGNTSTDDGGGVFANGTETFVNSVLAGNTTGPGASPGAVGSPLAAGGAANDVGGVIETAINSFFGSDATITDGRDNLNNQQINNLLLGNLFNNGGSVQTHKPQPSSVLIGAGSVTDLPTDLYDLDGDGNRTEALPVDATGKLRAPNGTVDIGAVEAYQVPIVTRVGTTNADGTYKIGDEITVTVTFGSEVIVRETNGSPTLLLETGNTDHAAMYASGSGSRVLTFTYMVQKGDTSIDLDYLSTAALLLNDATIQNSTGLDAILTLPTAGGENSIAGQHDIVIDGEAPKVISVNVPNDGYYVEDNQIEFTVNFNDDVTVNETNGIPYLEVVIGTNTVKAAYVGQGMDKNELLFRYSIQANEMDLDGITLGYIIPNGGSIQDASGNDAELMLNNVEPTNNVLVYAIVPSVMLSTQAASSVNEPFTLTVTFSEAVTDFTVGDINANNASLSNLQTTDNTVYTLLVTPVADGLVSLQIPAGAAKNIANIGNTASNTLNHDYDATAPAVPEGLDATAGDEEVTLSWTANTESDLAGYRIYGGTTDNPSTLLATVDEPLTTYTHSGLANGTVYYYRISSVDKVGNESRQTADVNARPKGDQIIAFEALADRTYGDAPFALTATASSGLAVSYISSDPSTASVSGNELTVHKAGTVEITARQTGNDAYNEATVVVQSLTINRKAVTVMAEDKTKVYGDADPALTYTVSPALVPSDVFTGELTRESGEDVGSYAIGQGTLALDANYELTFEGAVLEITASAGIDVTFPDGSFVYDGEEHRLIISGELPAGTSVRYAGNGLTNVGSQRVTASVEGGENYRDTVLTATLTITPAMRSINFGELPEKTYGDNDFEIGAVSSSGEEVSYRSSNTAVADITAEGLVHITGAGETTITAIVPENGNYSSSPSVSRTLTVRKARQEISFREVGEVDRHAGSIPLEVEASSGLPVSLQVSDEQVATVSGTELNILRLGTVVITASQAGDSNYEAAEAVSIRVRVTDPNETLPVRVHRALSPNGDGINEFLMVEGIRDYPENKLTVVDRNGMKIIEMEGYNNEDKVFRGLGPGNNPIPTGTYYYLLEVKVNGEWKFKKGYFVIRY